MIVKGSFAGAWNPNGVSPVYLMFFLCHQILISDNSATWCLLKRARANNFKVQVQGFKYCLQKQF